MGPDTETPESADTESDGNKDQPDIQAPGQARIDQDKNIEPPAPQLDVYGEPETEEIEPHLVRRTWSGRTYNAITSALELHSILKKKSSALETNSVSEEPSVLIEQIGYRRALNNALVHGLTHASQLP